MFTRCYWIETFQSGGAIGIMPRPRGNDWLAGEIERWAAMDIQTVVSLLEKDEIGELGLAEEETLCRRHQIKYISFPIRDRAVPADEPAAGRLIRRLVQRVDQGEKIAVHCRMGVGRAALIAGAVLVEKGVGPERALQQIAKARALRVPDTDEQVLWLKRLEKSRGRNQFP
jgi:protein-tyrosine phosphatase